MKKTNPKRKKRGSRKKDQSGSKPKVTSDSHSTSGKVGKEPGGKDIQSISKKESEKKGEEKGAILKYVNLAAQFLRESKMELKKVKWPTRKELLASTGMVIFLVLVVSFFLGLIDFGLVKIIKNIVG
jgi:preprotein translocase subunit SecE